MRDFRRLLDLSSPTVIDGAPENALIQPVFPDCLIYIKNKEGVIIDSEYILPNGDFFSRKWKGGKTADNRSVMLSIMKSNN